MSIGWWVGPHTSNCGVDGGRESSVYLLHVCWIALLLTSVQYARSPDEMRCLLCIKRVTIVPDLFPM